MLGRWWFAAVAAVGGLVGSPAVAQVTPDPVALRLVHQLQTERVLELGASRHEAALGLLNVANEVAALPGGARSERRQRLVEAQELAERIAFLDEELTVAVVALRDSRRALLLALEARIAAEREVALAADPPARKPPAPGLSELEAELAAVRNLDDAEAAPDPLVSGEEPLLALARAVAVEHARLERVHTLHDELRLFLAQLRLFDDTGMPPSVRGDGAGNGEPGCPATACPLTFSPGDVPLTLATAEGQVATAGRSLTMASLALLDGRLAAHIDPVRRSAGYLAREVRTVAREVGVGSHILAFRDEGRTLAGVGPRASAAFHASRPLGTASTLTVEPSLGVRSLRAASSTSLEMAGEARETLTGAWGGGRLRWQATSWQKARFLTDPLPLPGYLEPGRVEGGVGGRLALPIRSGIDVVAGAGGDAVRYDPDEWKILDRQGGHASLGLAWRGEAGTGRVAFTGSRHAFPVRAFHWDPRRVDTRFGMDGEVLLEGALVVRVSGGLAWNDSRLPAYDHRVARMGVVLASALGSGVVQGYAALARQVYHNPGTEGARVAPSDHDTGSILAVQHVRPWGSNRSLGMRAEWSRSETGFRDDFYHRVGISVHLGFRGAGVSDH